MSRGIYASGSIGNLDVPLWARKVGWVPTEISVGSMAIILPIGGPVWMGEIVIVIGEVKTMGGVRMYRVMGRKGETLMMKYALDIVSEVG